MRTDVKEPALGGGAQKSRFPGREKSTGKGCSQEKKIEASMKSKE